MRDRYAETFTYTLDLPAGMLWSLYAKNRIEEIVVRAREQGFAGTVLVSEQPHMRPNVYLVEVWHA